MSEFNEVRQVKKHYQDDQVVNKPTVGQII